MPDRLSQALAPDDTSWSEGLTRVPYWVFQREDVCKLEQKRLFSGEY